jgi:hypothetical protein
MQTPGILVEGPPNRHGRRRSSSIGGNPPPSARESGADEKPPMRPTFDRRVRRHDMPPRAVFSEDLQLASLRERTANDGVERHGRA